MDNSSLINLVKSAIKDVLDSSTTIDDSLKEKYPQLNEQRASFVTLNLNGNLRGCIGSLIPQRTLFDDLVHNAKAAAFADPRFKPLNKKEFENIDIEISILSLPSQLEYKDTNDLKNKIRVGIDGLILKDENHQATFLPSVWSQLPTFELFFSHLCAKANLNQNCLENHPDIYIYQTQKIK